MMGLYPSFPVSRRGGRWDFGGVGLPNEGAVGAFVFCGNALLALIIVEAFVALGALPFPPEEKPHDGGNGGSVLDVFQQGIHAGGDQSEECQSRYRHDGGYDQGMRHGGEVSC